MKNRTFSIIIITGVFIFASVKVFSQVSIPVTTKAAYSNLPGYLPNYATDGNTSTGWKPATQNSTEWITFDLGATNTKFVKSLYIKFGMTPYSFIVSGSTNDVDYIPLTTVNITNVSCKSGSNTIDINSSVLYRYLKISGFTYTYNGSTCTDPVYIIEVTVSGIGGVALGDIGSYVTLSAWDKLRVQSVNGYIDIGALTVGSANINTDRPIFLFNKDVSTTGNISAIGNILMSQTGSFGFVRARDGVVVPMISVTPNGSTSNLQIGSGSGEFYGGYTDIFGGTSTKMRILSNGNVGIGILTPNSLLTVNGDIATTKLLDLNNTAYYLSPSNSATSLNVAGNIIAAKFTDLNNTAFYLDPSNSTTSLNVAGNIIASKFTDLNNTAYYLAPSNSTTSLNVAGNIIAAKFTDLNNTAYYLAPSNSATSLNVAGNIIASKFTDLNNTAYYLAPSNSTTSLNVAGNIIASKFTDLNNTAYYLSPSSTTTSLIVAGQVGIGTDPTSTLTAMLTVKGLILASEIKVIDISLIPDYVFKPNYNLMSLHDLDSYVKENHHLPEVPSAGEFRENGMNVSEMNALLLKKVEELTLYIIDQNKNIELQNEKISELEKMNKRIENLEKAQNLTK